MGRNVGIPYDDIDNSIDNSFITCLNVFMALTKDDLEAIDKIFASRIMPVEVRLGRKIDKIDRKFIKLFNFLDKDLSNLKGRLNKVENRLGVSTSEF